MASTSFFVPVEYWRLVRGNPNYRRLWIAQVISEIGDWFYSIAIYSLLLDLTGKAGSVALALVLQVLPQTFIGPTAGVVNDRMSRKRVMIAADLARVLIVFSMLLVRSRSMVWLVYPLLLVETLMAAFFEPARSSVIPNITPTDQLTTANTLASTTWSFNLAIGSALGGLVGLLLGRDAVFVINALSFLGSALLIMRMRFDEPHLESSPPLRAHDLVDFEPIVEGARYIAHDGRRLVTVFAKTGIGILGVAWVVFPVMAEKVFPLTWLAVSPSRRTMLGMSLLMSARGVGAIIGPLLSAGWVRQDEQRLRRMILVGYLAAGVGYLGVSVSPTLAIACLAVVVSHMGASSVWVHSTTLLQLRTDDEFRGRVFSTEFGLCMASIAAAAYLSGVAIDHGIGPREVAAVAGALVFVPAIAWAMSGRVWRSKTFAADGTNAS
jgi:predicted MFS family arabinose efflux permease